MNCQRCNGTMVEEMFEDLRDDTGSIRFPGWRCMLCGEILDPVILKNRASPSEPCGSGARLKTLIRLGG